MYWAVPLTHYAEYHAQAKAIQQRLVSAPASPAAYQQALVDLGDLPVRALAETCDRRPRRPRDGAPPQRQVRAPGVRLSPLAAR